MAGLRAFVAAADSMRRNVLGVGRTRVLDAGRSIGGRGGLGVLPSRCRPAGLLVPEAYPRPDDRVCHPTFRGAGAVHRRRHSGGVSHDGRAARGAVRSVARLAKSSSTRGLAAWPIDVYTYINRTLSENVCKSPFPPAPPLLAASPGSPSR